MKKEKRIKLKYIIQRAKKGYSDYDVYEIDTWFLSIMPKMLNELIKNSNSFPDFIVQEYMHKNNITVYEMIISDEKISGYCLNRWQDILIKMKNKFIEASKDNKNNHIVRKEALYMFAQYFDNLWW